MHSFLPRLRWPLVALLTSIGLTAHNGSARVERASSSGARFVVMFPTASLGPTT